MCAQVCTCECTNLCPHITKKRRVLASPFSFPRVMLSGTENSLPCRMQACGPQQVHLEVWTELGAPACELTKVMRRAEFQPVLSFLGLSPWHRAWAACPEGLRKMCPSLPWVYAYQLPVPRGRALSCLNYQRRSF